MNSFSTFGGMLGRGTTTNPNTILYIEKYAKNHTVDFSGSSFIDLSAASSYAHTACGLNIGNENSTFARLKYNGNYLKTADFNSGSFTIYLKHAARYSTLPALNFQYPNVLTVSSAYTSVGSPFTVSFYSSLNPGTSVPYVISGCTPTDLGISSLIGTFTSPYQANIYTLSGSVVSGITIAFNVSGGTNATV